MIRPTWWRTVLLRRIWREWEGDRGTKKALNVGKHLLFSFLTTEPNSIVEPIREKAMPVLNRTKAEAEQWLEAPAEEALLLQKTACAPSVAADTMARHRRLRMPS